MPKPNKGNKSQAIREMIAQHPQAGSKEIVSLLAGQGVKVNRSLVYFVRGQQRKRKRTQQRRRAVEASEKAGVANPVELVIAVKGLAQKAGGIRNLKALVDLLAD